MCKNNLSYYLIYCRTHSVLYTNLHTIVNISLKSLSKSLHVQGVFFTGPAQKSMELVPPSCERMTKFTEGSNIPTKKVKVQVRAC